MQILSLVAEWDHLSPLQKKIPSANNKPEFCHLRCVPCQMGMRPKPAAGVGRKSARNQEPVTTSRQMSGLKCMLLTFNFDLSLFLSLFLLIRWAVSNKLIAFTTNSQLHEGCWTLPSARPVPHLLMPCHYHSRGCGWGRTGYSRDKKMFAKLQITESARHSRQSRQSQHHTSQHPSVCTAQRQWLATNIASNGCFLVGIFI